MATPLGVPPPLQTPLRLAPRCASLLHTQVGRNQICTKSRLQTRLMLKQQYL